MLRNIVRLTAVFTFTFALLAITAGSAQAISVPSGAWGVDVDVAVFKKNGPDKHFTGSFLFSGDSLSGDGAEIIKLDDGILAASFTYKGVTYSPNKPKAKAKFVDGELVGLNLIYKHNGKKFQIKFGDFLAKKAVKGTVSYDNSAFATALALANAVPAADDVPGDVVTSVPTPAAVTGGLALFAAMAFRRRNSRA